MDARSTLRSILTQYPLSVALFREIVQNSDDAGATKQVCNLSLRRSNRLMMTQEFMLDHREEQGVALFSHNDGILTERDWKHIRTLHDSSKTADSS